MASTIRINLNGMFDRCIPMKISVDCKSLFDVKICINATAEKRLLTDILVILQRYESRKIAKVTWIATEQNPADDHTKIESKERYIFLYLLENNKLNIYNKCWVELRVSNNL